MVKGITRNDAEQDSAPFVMCVQLYWGVLDETWRQRPRSPALSWVLSPRTGGSPGVAQCSLKWCCILLDLAAHWAQPRGTLKMTKWTGRRQWQFMAMKIPERDKINHFFKHHLGWSWIRKMPIWMSRCQAHSVLCEWGGGCISAGRVGMGSRNAGAMPAASCACGACHWRELVGHRDVLALSFFPFLTSENSSLPDISVLLFIFFSSS